MNEIVREQWPTFFEQFSRSHHGWLVKIGVIDTHLLEQNPDAGAEHMEEMVEEAVFQGIQLVDDRAVNIELLVSAGETSQPSYQQVIHPRQIHFEQTAAGAHEGLRIDAANGQTTLVRFRTAARPEMLDGLAETEK